MQKPADDKNIWHNKFDNSLINMIESYHIDKYLGESYYGIVFAVSQGSNQYAAKVISLITETGKITDYQLELDIYKQISIDPFYHLYVICIYDHFIINGFTQTVGVLILELMDNTLFDESIKNDECPVILVF